MPDQNIDLTPGTGSFASEAEGNLAATALQNVVEDTTPQLGGSLDVNGNSIVSVAAGDIAITPDTTGDVVLDGLKWPQADGTVNQVIQTDGAGQLSFGTAISGITVQDEGSGIPNTPHVTLNFVGAGVTATDAGSSVATITIPGGGGSTFADDVFRIQDNADATKQLAFEVSAITTATTRTVTMPDANVDLADVNSALQSADIGVTVQGFDADTAKLDVAQAWAAVQTFPDTLFRIADNVTPAKLLAFEVSGIETGTTTWTVPIGNLDFAPNTGDFLGDVVGDTTPQLGGSLDVNGNSIVSVSAGDIAITPDTSGDVVLDGLKWPQADGTSGQVIRTDGAGQLSFVTVGGAQNLWETITSDSGSTVANTATDTLTIAGGTGISTAVSGDTLTITNTGGGPEFADNVFRVQDNADATKQLAFEISGVESASTVTWTVPIGSLDFAPGTGSFATAAEGDLAATALQDVVDDTTPVLGGSLDVGGNSIVSVSAGDIAITPDTSGDVVLDGLKWPQADGTANQVIETDGAGQLSFVTPSAGGGGAGGVGNIVQQVITRDGELQSGTTTIPIDDTIPQITEGFEVMTVAITPTNSNNILLIEAAAFVSNSVAVHAGMALFQDATASALASANHRQDADSIAPLRLLHRQTAGTTSSTTFRIRIGPNASGTMLFNGRASATREYGGNLASYIMITEIDPGNVLTVTTTDSTQTTIGSISVASGVSTSFELVGIGREDATGDTLRARIEGAIERTGATTALVGANATVETDTAGATLWSIVAEANDGTDALDIKVTGEAAHTIDWKVITKTVEV